MMPSPLEQSARADPDDRSKAKKYAARPRASIALALVPCIPRNVERERISMLPKAGNSDFRVECSCAMDAKTVFVSGMLMSPPPSNDDQK
jgi:hypothetical protein